MPPRPTFALFRAPTFDDDEFARWQAWIDRQRVMTPEREAIAAACRAAEAVICRRPDARRGG
ncbi:MAG: hypothetical protein JO290_04450 [Sphingomonadaceae bacterium]|nr:hypothetical protein [Sphingomonadaceae bacterium]